jgi:hypothetical protein
MPSDYTMLWVAVAVLITLHLCHRKRSRGTGGSSLPAGWVPGSAGQPPQRARSLADGAAPVTGADPAVAAAAVPIAF